MKLTLRSAWKKRLKMWAEGNRLRAEGDRLWADAVSSNRGKIISEWEWIEEKENYRCKLQTGEVFEP